MEGQPLRRFLLAGGRVDPDDGLWDLISSAPRFSSAERERRAASAQYHLDLYESHVDPHPDMFTDGREPDWDRAALVCAWEHEYLSTFPDAELDRLLWNGLDTEEAARMARRLENERRPHPLSLERKAIGANWSCDNCGSPAEDTDRDWLVIGSQQDYSDTIGYEIHYCPDCVGIIADTQASERRGA